MSDFSSDSEMETDRDELDLLFTQATEHIQRTQESYYPYELLLLYALYKQATSGRCNIAEPGVFNLQGRAKWSAWNDLGDMPSNEAKKKYIERVQQLDPTFCEQLKKGIKQKSINNWVVHSVQALPDDLDESLPEHEYTCFDHVKKCNFERLKAEFKHEYLKQVDDHGMGLIHWATDRNAIEMLKFLLEAGAEVNMLDVEKQTPLHYAASCGYVECVKLLLHHNADPMLKDEEGQTCIDIADDDVRHIFEKL